MNDPYRRFQVLAQSSFSNADLTSTGIDLSEFDGPCSLQFSWSSIAGSDLTTPTFVIQESNDKSRYDTIAAKTITMTSAIAALESITMQLDTLHSNYYRVKVRGSDVSAGLIQCIGCFKGRARP